MIQSLSLIPTMMADVIMRRGCDINHNERVSMESFMMYLLVEKVEIPSGC